MILQAVGHPRPDRLLIRIEGLTAPQGDVGAAHRPVDGAFDLFVRTVRDHFQQIDSL